MAMPELEIERRPWDEQRAVDDGSYRRQLSYVLAHSAFYRAKLGAVGIADAEEA